jgi:uncharacterized protein HemX
MNNPSGIKSSRGKTMFIGIVIAIFIAIGLFATGYIKGRAQVSTLQSQLTQRDAQLLISQNRSYLMQARAALYHTAIDLDQRNFGTANSRLQEAASALGNMKQDSSTIDMEKIAQLRNAIAAMNINVAVNLEDQRKHVLDLASQLDNLQPALR